MLNGLITGLLLVTASTEADAYSAFESRRNQAVEIQIEITKCVQAYEKFGRYNHYNFQQLKKLSSDRWGGYVDPGLINQALYEFIDRKARLDDEIRQILSEYPDSKRCQKAVNRAFIDVRRYTRDLVNPYDLSNSTYK